MLGQKTDLESTFLPLEATKSFTAGLQVHKVLQTLQSRWTVLVILLTFLFGIFYLISWSEDLLQIARFIKLPQNHAFS